MKMLNKRDIDYLIIWKNLNGIATAKEQVEFVQWLNASGEHKKYYTNLKENYENVELIITPEDIRYSWKKLNRVIKPRKYKLLKRSLQVAAAVVIPVMLMFSVMKLVDNAKQKQEISQLAHSGNVKVILQLGDGRLVSLHHDDKQLIQNEKGEVIGADSLDVLNYKQSNNSKLIDYNTITIPRGGEYKLILADGTKVWLNSETELHYPVTFLGNTREVSLKGEAYFEVAHNSEKPFIVKTKNQVVKVLGTSFNISSYEDDAFTNTTLVEGCVSINYSVDNQMIINEISPGEQYSLKKSIMQGSIKKVRPMRYIAWKDGWFIFRHEPLEQIMTRLGRWYNVETCYEDEELKSILFTGNLHRSNSLDDFLSILKWEMSVKVRLENHTLYISK